MINPGCFDVECDYCGAVEQVEPEELVGDPPSWGVSLEELPEGWTFEACPNCIAELGIDADEDIEARIRAIEDETDED